jgi:hypothetical protein
MAIGTHFDPLGETEPHTTPYTLTVYIPLRAPPKWAPSIFIRAFSMHPNSGSTYKLPASMPSPNYDCFELKDLADLPTKAITIKSAWFPAHKRCTHVQGLGNGGQKVCNQGCYFLEKGGEHSRWHCRREDCEGHVYCGRVKQNEEGVSCFGKKGERMVCLER